MNLAGEIEEMAETHRREKKELQNGIEELQGKLVDKIDVIHMRAHIQIYACSHSASTFWKCQTIFLLKGFCLSQLVYC